MAETLKARVGRVIAGGVHALLDRIEGQAPEAMMEQALREADAVIDEVRHELGLVAANRHLAQQRHADLNRQHETLASHIGEAISQKRDDLARAAVARQLDIEAQIPVLESTLADHARQETELRGYVDALVAKKREMSEALSQFRKSRAAQTVSTSAVPANGSASRMAAASDAFDRIYERQTGLSVAGRGASLEQAAQLKELDDLVRNNKISERLAQIKAGQA